MLCLQERKGDTHSYLVLIRKEAFKLGKRF